MKFTVEVEDFYLEEEDLNQGIKDSIKGDVIRQINDRVKSQVAVLVDNILKESVEKELAVRVNVLVHEFLETGMVNKDRYNDKDKISVKSWIAQNIKVQSDSIDTYIKKSVSAIGVELKNRYDIMFASQIITKINEQGYLKEDVAKLLLEPVKP